MQPGGASAPPINERNQPMQNQTDRFVINARLLELSETLSAGCDPEFDNQRDDLEREFQELRLQLHNFE